MDNNLYNFLAIFAAGIAMAFTRLIPHIAFAKRDLPDIVKFFEKYLPYSLMVILFAFFMSTVKFLKYPFGLPEILALIVGGILQFWKNNIILSLSIGSILYLFVVRYI